ncbi:MAG TPA: M13-type metalloendopeptidase, partial [Vicinamibacterales bacterium]|nr:M13-type metalloendopeptidase [Vicinamibacterales bacterium]
GAARDWWTPADAAAAAERTRRLAAQLEQYEPVAGVRVSGSLTVAETLADIGGLTIAYRAYKSSLKGATPPTIDRLTGDQRFFMGWAQMWRAKQRDEYVRSMLQTSAHLAAVFRANAAVGQVDAFYDAFGVKPDNRLYRAPAERVRIW